MRICNQAEYISQLTRLRTANLGHFPVGRTSETCGASPAGNALIGAGPAHTESSGRTRSPERFGRLGALLLLCVVLAAGFAAVLPAPAAAREVSVTRSIFLGRAGAGAKELQPGGDVEMRGERWLVSDPERLRVESTDPEIKLLLRFEPKDGKAGTLSLTIALFNPRKQFDYQHQQQSSVMRGGRLETLKELRLGEGLETDLGGVRGEVEEITIQDDGTRELRLELRGNLLVLHVIPFEEGGNPSGAYFSYFDREPLYFLDYTLLAGGYEQNAYGELVLFEDFAVMGNVITDDTNTVILARGVLRQQLLRWRRVAVSVEGGPAFYTFDPVDTTDEDDSELLLVLGTTLNFRYGNWGAALHVSSVSGSSLAMLMGGWQFSKSFGALIEWQSFQGLSDFGLGGSWKF